MLCPLPAQSAPRGGANFPSQTKVLNPFFLPQTTVFDFSGLLSHMNKGVNFWGGQCSSTPPPRSRNGYLHGLEGPKTQKPTPPWGVASVDRHPITLCGWALSKPLGTVPPPP